MWDLLSMYRDLLATGSYYYDFGNRYELVTPPVPIMVVFSNAYQYYATQLIFCGIVVAVVLIAIVYVLSFVRRKNKRNEKSGVIKIIEARKYTTLVTDFLLFYILPMIAFDFSSTRDIFLFAVYFAFIAFLSIRNENVYTNVLFEFLGYKVYKCDVERNVLGKPYQYYECAVISKNNITSKVGEEISCFIFENTIYLNVTNPQRGETK